jgi:THAP4-like, heme-binding beta-barrel domain
MPAQPEQPGSSAYADTTDLRSGPELHEALLALLPLVGVWQGVGAGVRPADELPFRYAQELAFAHDGRPFLSYESRTWLIDDDNRIIRAAAREAGFWRPGAGPDDVEVMTALATGIVQILTGVAGDQRWELETAELARTATAKEVAGEKRLYAISGDSLVYAQELAVRPGDFRPHLSAQLQRLKASGR